MSFVSTDRFVLVPGFGDTVDYWRKKLPFTSNEIDTCPWPGIWGTPGSLTPYTDVVNKLKTLATSSTVVVAHSLGARAALAAAALNPPKALVLVAPAVGSPSFAAPDKLLEWRQRGFRPTTRPSPVNGSPVTWDISYEFIADMASFPAPVSSRCPTLVVVMSGDRPVFNEAIAQVFDLASTTPVNVDGPHRWWEDEISAYTVVSTIADWLDQLEYPPPRRR